MKSQKRNWRQYNKSLIQRGSLTFWVRKDLLRAWHAKKIPHKKGRPFLFSDTAILTATVLRFVFHLFKRIRQHSHFLSRRRI